MHVDLGASRKIDIESASSWWLTFIQEILRVVCFVDQEV